MLTFFGWSHNIVSRNVEIMRPGDHHVLNEFYLPELKKWVMVDLTNNILLVQKDGRLLNTQDFVQSLSQPETVMVLTGDSMVNPLIKIANWPQIRQYYQEKFPFQYYHVTYPDAVYSPNAKVRRYFLPDSWYEIFTPSSKVAVLFYVKLIFVAIWVVLGSLILVKRYYDRRKRPPEKFWR